MGLSSTSILDAAVEMVGRLHTAFPAEHLDIESGNGDLIKLLLSRFDVKSSACDYTENLMMLTLV
jgi:hypothetical protein